MMTVKFVVDRGVSHELVRHRLCSFSQESTRYCNYKGGITFIIPPWLHIHESNTDYYDISRYHDPELLWLNTMRYIEIVYIDMLDHNWTPQQARSVLPNSLKTELVMTANFREWKHIFKLRTSKAAHPQMREIMIPLLNKAKELIPVIFDGINIED
jgi:thymidylate synthase (FAD)